MKTNYSRDLFNTIKTRRSIRRFINKDVNNKLIEKIIDAAIHAPSACNIQGWRFIIIKDDKTKKKIVDAGAASFILKAPVGVLVLYDNRTDNLEYNDHIQSGAAAIQNMILAAWSLNIGCCWACHLPPRRQLRKILNIPKIYDPIAYVVMGYFNQKPADVPRKLPLKDIMSYNKFKFNEKIKYDFGLIVKKICRKIYYLIPLRKYIKPTVDKKFEKKFD